MLGEQTEAPLGTSLPRRPPAGGQQAVRGPGPGSPAGDAIMAQKDASWQPPLEAVVGSLGRPSPRAPASLKPSLPPSPSQTEAQRVRASPRAPSSHTPRPSVRTEASRAPWSREPVKCYSSPRHRSWGGHPRAVTVTADASSRAWPGLHPLPTSFPGENTPAEGREDRRGGRAAARCGLRERAHSHAHLCLAQDQPSRVWAD